MRLLPSGCRFPPAGGTTPSARRSLLAAAAAQPRGLRDWMPAPAPRRQDSMPAPAARPLMEESGTACPDPGWPELAIALSLPRHLALQPLILHHHGSLSTRCHELRLLRRHVVVVDAEAVEAVEAAEALRRGRARPLCHGQRHAAVRVAPHHWLRHHSGGSQRPRRIFL